MASLAELLGQEDPQLEHILGIQAIATHWGELPAREQTILALRFYGGMTQAQIGQQLGLSQVRVSRLPGLALWGYLAAAWIFSCQDRPTRPKPYHPAGSLPARCPVTTARVWLRPPLGLLRRRPTVSRPQPVEAATTASRAGFLRNWTVGTMIAITIIVASID